MEALCFAADETDFLFFFFGLLRKGNEEFLIFFRSISLSINMNESKIISRNFKGVFGRKEKAF